jgi:tetratricopeptide (TPR) repeat protein
MRSAGGIMLLLRKGTMRAAFIRVLVVLVSLYFCVAARSQSPEAGKEVYSSSHDSVFLIYLNDSSGQPTALGSGFLIGPRLLITNAHVVDAGEPVLAVGPVRIPLKVISIDKTNDLAELSVTADLTSKPLPLSSEIVKPGEQIYTIGNPEGLEKTISQGIVSGVRQREGRNLIQITSPISHGSSGGPVLNSSGEVVGVAVGMLEDGQNLNFAVPVACVKKLMEHQADAPAVFNLQTSLKNVSDLFSKMDQIGYSDDPASGYQVALHDLRDVLKNIVQNTDNSDALNEVACYGTKAIELSDAGIEAARKLVKIKPSAENQALLAYMLYDRAGDEDMNAVLAKDGSDGQRGAKAAHDKFLSEAGTTASLTLHSAQGNALMLDNFILGRTKTSSKDYAAAISFDAQVVGGEYSICDTDIVKEAYQDLIENSTQTNRMAEAEKWFRAYANKYQPSAWEWDQEGDRRVAASDLSNAAQAYENAAVGSNYITYDYCFASVERYLQIPQNADAVLSDGRACIDASTKNNIKSNEHYFSDQIPAVYAYMADVLTTRGVYSEAMQYAKEAINKKPDYAYGYYTEALIYDRLQQNTECIAAAQNAIRVSDGKFPSMHFLLGNCYFSTENWAMAANSFRISAEADKSDAPSAYNLALALMNDHHDVEAQEWLREALRRNPDSDIRARITKLMH